jgi:hypothetical protein
LRYAQDLRNRVGSFVEQRAGSGGSVGAFVGRRTRQVNALDAAHNTEYYASIYCWTVETIRQYEGCTFHYSVNGAEPVSTTEKSVSMTGLPDGTNSFAVYATDAYGNVDASLNTNMFTWTIGECRASLTSLIGALGSLCVGGIARGSPLDRRRGTYGLCGAIPLLLHQKAFIAATICGSVRHPSQRGLCPKHTS